jgi:hypothetical protein
MVRRAGTTAGARVSRLLLVSGDGAENYACPVVARLQWYGDGVSHRTEGPVGDKSPKSKTRDQKQKTAAKTESAARAKSKQDSYSQPKPPGRK